MEKCTLQDLEYGEKKTNKENEKHTLQDMEYSEKTDKQRKWETHIVGPGIQQEN